MAKTKIKTEKTLSKLIEEIAIMRKKVLDDFFKAYLADQRIPLNKLELVEEELPNGLGRRWYFRIRED